MKKKSKPTFKATIDSKEFNRLKNDSITKEYVNNKLADMRRIMTTLTHKENEKFNALIEILTMRKAITAEDADKVLRMQPFALI